MTALIFGTWPDGKPIIGPGDVGIGECRHFEENPLTEYDCNLDSVSFFRKGNLDHFGHFHVTPKGSR